VRKRHALALSIPLALIAINFLLVPMVMPTKEQRTAHSLLRIRDDIYEYRHRHAHWPSSLRDAWEGSSRIHKDDWDAYSTDAWGNPIDYRVEDDGNAVLTVRGERRDAARSMDSPPRMERRLSVADPMFESFAPLTNSTHDAEF